MRGTINHKFTKAKEMSFYCARDLVEHKHFEVNWKRGHMNLGYYFTKHHPPTHHQIMQQTYLLNATISIKIVYCDGVIKLGT